MHVGGKCRDDRGQGEAAGGGVGQDEDARRTAHSYARAVVDDSRGVDGEEEGEGARSVAGYDGR